MRLPAHSAPTEWKGSSSLRCPHPYHDISGPHRLQPLTPLDPPSLAGDELFQPRPESTTGDPPNHVSCPDDIPDKWTGKRGLPLRKSPGWKSTSLPTKDRSFGPPSFSPRLPSLLAEESLKGVGRYAHGGEQVPVGAAPRFLFFTSNPKGEKICSCQSITGRRIST